MTFDEWLNEYWKTNSAGWDDGSMMDAYNAGKAEQIEVDAGIADVYSHPGEVAEAIRDQLPQEVSDGTKRCT